MCLIFSRTHPASTENVLLPMTVQATQSPQLPLLPRLYPNPKPKVPQQCNLSHPHLRLPPRLPRDRHHLPPMPRTLHRHRVPTTLLPHSPPHASFQRDSPPTSQWPVSSIHIPTPPGVLALTRGPHHLQQAAAERHHYPSVCSLFFLPPCHIQADSLP